MRVLSRAMVRVPLLPVRALEAPEAALRAHPLGPAAVGLASPSLSAHGDERAAEAWRGYGKRAAFRATPRGLWSGVGVARVVEGPSTLRFERTRVHLDLAYARLAALGRALLDEEAGWQAARVRCAPSLLRSGSRLSWLAYGEGASARSFEVESDPLLDRVLAAAERWIPATRLARVLAAETDARAVVLQLVDDGLLLHDLEPPLVGPSPSTWAGARLLPLCPELATVLAILEDDARPIEQRLAAAHAALADLPGAGLHEPIVATLVAEVAADSGIARAPLERAAALVPRLLGLNQALAPPLREEVPGLVRMLEAVSAVSGEGLIGLEALELGDHGGRLGGELDVQRADEPVLSWLTARVLAAARVGADEIDLRIDDLDQRLPAIAVPTTCELFLTPAGERPGGLPGDDWLLGVHAPAGASWGRFAAALGRPLDEALAELARSERKRDDGVLRVDVAYAPSRELADLCLGPALRDATLALTSWPEAGALVPAQCLIANEPAGPAHGGLVAAGRPLYVSPLHRVRSTTAPPSVHRALLADQLVRQHAPWALAWGALGAAPWLPRVRLDGFVISPQSWALPAQLDRATLDAWRVRHHVPRLIQVGVEDRLLPLDLDEPADCALLARLPVEERARAHEIWPPLGRELEPGGHRLELCVAVVDEREDPRARRLAALRQVPIAEDARARGWRTVKLFAARERHPALLAGLLAPFVARRRPRGWFVLPYVDPPGERAHLRVRLGAGDDAGAARLAEALARAASDAGVVPVEIGPYVRETARWGRAADRVERVFESDSLLVVELCGGAVPGLADELLLALSLDALARGLRVPLAGRRLASAAAFAAQGVTVGEEREVLAPGYRAVQAVLGELIGAAPEPFAAHARRVRQAGVRSTEAAELLPALAHLAAVRLGGPDPALEVRALYLWMRAVDGLAARTVKGARPRSRRARR